MSNRNATTSTARHTFESAKDLLQPRAHEPKWRTVQSFDEAALSLRRQIDDLRVRIGAYLSMSGASEAYHAAERDIADIQRGLAFDVRMMERQFRQLEETAAEELSDAS